MHMHVQLELATCIATIMMPLADCESSLKLHQHGTVTAWHITDEAVGFALLAPSSSKPAECCILMVGGPLQSIHL